MCFWRVCQASAQSASLMVFASHAYIHRNRDPRDAPAISLLIVSLPPFLAVAVDAAPFLVCMLAVPALVYVVALYASSALVWADAVSSACCNECYREAMLEEAAAIAANAPTAVRCDWRWLCFFRARFHQVCAWIVPFAAKHLL